MHAASRDYSTRFSGFLVLGQADPCIPREPFEIFGQGLLQATPRSIENVGRDPGSPVKMDELKVRFFLRRVYYSLIYGIPLVQMW